MKTSSTLILCFFLLLASCTKNRFGADEGPSASGHVYAKYSEEPLLAAEIDLYLVTFTGWTSPDRREYIGTTLTDQNGYFEFNFDEPESLSRYEVEARKNGYFNEMRLAGKNIALFLEPEAAIRIHIKNVDPFDEEDRIELNSPCGVYVFEKESIDTTVSCAIRPERYSKTYYWVTKNGITTAHKDSVFVALENDITELEIRY
jgi:hypothetical protein